MLSLRVQDVSCTRKYSCSKYKKLVTEKHKINRKMKLKKFKPLEAKTK